MWAVQPPQDLHTHAKADTLFSPPGVGNHRESPRVGGSRVHPCEARGGEYSPGHRAPPCATHPPSTGWASPGAAGNESRLLDSKHRTEHRHFPLSPLSAIVLLFLPPMSGCCKSLVAGSAGGAGPQAAPGGGGSCTCSRRDCSSRPPLPGLGTPPEAGGGRRPAGQGRTPALPGEVCKHSCSRALEPLEMRP